MAGRRKRRAQVGDRGLAAALFLTAGSAVVPGLAHLRGGRRSTGAVLLTAFALLIGAGAVVGVTTSKEEALQLLVQQRVLLAVMVGAAGLALAWCMLLISSYRVVRPWYPSPAVRVTGGFGVLTLCLAVIAPLAVTARYAYVQHDLISGVFSNEKPGFKTTAGEDFWKNKPRLNILLLGGDAGPDRTGVRTDSMMLASIDTHTGATVLLSLPRNLERAQMPEGPARERFPEGFTGDGAPGNNLLNAVWEYGVHHPNMVPRSSDPGPDLLKSTISTILGQPVDYYVLVNLFGFRDIVDAFGGVTIKINEPIQYGRQGRQLEPGLRKLNGSQALWYARSRTNSSDYKRMERQRCVVGAIARQANPQKVLTRFQQIAGAAKKVISTDLPASLLPPLVTLAAKAKTAPIESVTFTPPLINPGRPDFETIQQITADAIAGSGKPGSASTPVAATAKPTRTPKPRESTRTPSTRKKSKTKSPTPRPSVEPKAASVAVDTSCQ